MYGIGMYSTTLLLLLAEYALAPRAGKDAEGLHMYPRSCTKRY